MGCIGLGLAVAVGVVFGLAGGLLASFLILGMSWVGGGAFVFSLGFFMGRGAGTPSVGSVAALVGVSWAGSGVAWGYSRDLLVGAVVLWRILGSCCCCFLPAAAVVMALVLFWVGQRWILAGGVCFCPLLAFGFWVLVGSSGWCPEPQN